ncbi:MAG TPA: C39 family peptidase [Chloroflexota bacterium]|nr:C39 family peptidase [Chloroflexota bacterium]
MPVLPVRHVPQENEAGCLAACSQMVLRFLGIKKSQRALNHLFQPTAFGVPFSRLTRLQRFDVVVSIRLFGDDRSLIQAIDQQTPAIVFVRTRPLPYWQADTQHAIIIVGYDDAHFLVNDPAFKQSPLTVPTTSLLLAWDGMDYAYALITH